MKDLFENNSLNFVLVNDWDGIFDGNIIPIAITEEINNCLWFLFFNFNFLILFEDTNQTPYCAS